MSEIREKWTDEKIKELIENLYVLQLFGQEGLKLKIEGEKNVRD